MTSAMAESFLPVGTVMRAYGFIQSLGPAADARTGKPTSPLSSLPEWRACCDRVLGATDVEDLEIRLDEMEMRFADLLVELQRVLTSSTKPHQWKLGLDDEALIATLGSVAAGQVRGSVPYVRAFWQSVQKMPPLKPPEHWKPDFSVLTELPYNSEVPLAAREAVADIIRGVSAAAVVLRASEIGEGLEPTVAQRLAEIFTRGFAKLLEAVVLLPILQSAEGLAQLAQSEGYKEHFEDQRRYNAFIERVAAGDESHRKDPP